MTSGPAGDLVNGELALFFPSQRVKIRTSLLLLRSGFILSIYEAVLILKL